jgi:hypothetical protein
MYSDEHRNLIRSFQEVCYWNYGIRCALKVMCGYSYKRIDYHMYRVIMSMKEYWILQVCKLFDKKYTFGDKNKPNLVLDYVIDEVPWPTEVKANLQRLKREMQPFADHLKDARDRVVAHHDLKALVEQKDEWFGRHATDDEIRFYDLLLDFLNTAQAAIDGSPPLEWPPFAQTDAKEFMMILERDGYAFADDI